MNAQSEHTERRKRAAAHVEQRKLDGLIVSAAPNVRYLTGFTGSNGIVLLTRKEAILFTDPRYRLQAAQETDCRVKVARGSLHPVVMKAVTARKLRRVGFESGRVTFDAYQRFCDGLALGAALHPAAGIVETVRMVKSPAEIARIEQSVQVNSAAYDKAIRLVRPGMTEMDLATELDYQMRLLGAEKPAFDTLVASGPRSALVHAQPTAHPIRNNQLLLIDMGACRDGYASDMTRMAFLGRPGRKARDLYRAVLEAQLAAIAVVRPGVPAGKVDQAARRVLRSAGLDRLFVHSTGHGLGLEIHEPPRLGKRDETLLEEGMAVTVEPGVYLEGYGGIRIEDTVAVTRSGCRILTPTSKELLVL